VRLRLSRQFDQASSMRIGVERGRWTPYGPIPPEEDIPTEHRELGLVLTETELWFVPPDWLRIEERSTAGSDVLCESTVVKAGDVYWLHDADGSLGTNEDDRRLNWVGVDGERHLDPAALAATSYLEVPGDAEWLGRAAVAFRARPRRGASRTTESWPWAAMHDGATGVVDAERGVPLRFEILAGDTTISTTLATEVALDERIDPALFAPLR
jgi:outer membrane lipoprotein-sorting protein